jgi:hypothetical protein
MKALFRTVAVVVAITAVAFLQTIPAEAAAAPEATSLISRYTTNLAVAPNNNLVVEGRTQTYSVVHTVSVTVYLQVWDGSKWQDVRSWTSTRSNDNLAYLKVSVGGLTKGYYYRTRGVHKATQHNVTETLYSYSGSIYY